MVKAKKRKSRRALSAVHLLDVGEAQYGDCLLCEVGGESILIDGGHKEDFFGSEGHPSIPDQVRDLLGVTSGEAAALSLIVISHAHDDHVGCIPEMVAQGVITAEWAFMVDPDLAWSNAPTDDSSADSLLAALREEPRLDIDSRADYEVFARDASKLQSRYRAMIERLRRDGTKVVLHGKTPLGPLERRFRGIGLQVIGPSKAHLKACSDIILGVGRDFVRDASQALTSDADPSVMYRQLQALWQIARDAGEVTEPDGSDAEATDAMRSLGPVINLQSSAFVLDDGTHRFLFSGDLQLEKPECKSETIAASLEEMLAKIAQRAPYDFVKLGHHGSYNAFGDRVMESIGEETRNFGICTGAKSLHHPNRKAIELLKSRSKDITWARTDKNGAITFEFGTAGPSVETSRGQLNDATPPSSDEAPNKSPAVGGAQANAVITPAQEGVRAATPIHISIPYVVGTDIEVSFTLKIASPVASQIQPATKNAASSAVTPSIQDLADFRLAGGRGLPPLLFITNSQKLSGNVGSQVVGAILNELRRAKHVVVDVAGLDGDALAIAKASAHVALQKERHIEGVVIVGGYDVIPAERRDVAPGIADEDRDFDGEDRLVVWSDSGYADCDEDGLAELPVSRVPDGRSGALLLAALSAPSAVFQNRHGVRNVARPFADRIYTHLNGVLPMLSSDPHTRHAPNYQVSGDHVYLMLHGDYEDATRYWGEHSDGALVEALDISQVHLDPGTVVFTGCCWGGLTVVEPAGVLARPHPTPRTPADSIALRALSQGALAFVGCTGMHYSPVDDSIDTASAPLHDGFWRRLRQGLAPAEALFEAKKEFIADPDRAKSPLGRKIFEQFTVLGLGW